MNQFNGFEKYGIAHTSASQINMWMAAPCAWAAKYVYGHKSTFGCAAQVGVLVEKVVANVLLGGDIDKCIKTAEDTFNKNNALNTNAKDRKRVEDIRPMSELAVAQLAPYGEPEFIKTMSGYDQQRIDIACNLGAFSLPIIGYLDFVYPAHNLIIDLKTTARLPRSKMSDSHIRQGAIYKKARSMDMKFLYVSSKDFVWHEVTEEQMNYSLNEIKKVLTRQNKLLLLTDETTLKDIIPVNTDTFYWTGDESKRTELYGI